MIPYKSAARGRCAVNLRSQRTVARDRLVLTKAMSCEMSSGMQNMLHHRCGDPQCLQQGILSQER